MRTNTLRRLASLAALVAMASASAGCNTLQRLSDVGGGPELSQIANPTARPSYRPVSLPMPAPRIPENNPNSLWRAGARAFFKDQRANEVGDILTVKLDLDDSATLANKTERERDDAEDADLTSFLGLEDELSKKFLLIRGTPPVGMYVLDMFCMRGSRLWGSRLHRACVV